MSVLNMFLKCNGLPQKRLYFKKKVLHNIKENMSKISHGSTSCTCQEVSDCKGELPSHMHMISKYKVSGTKICGILRAMAINQIKTLNLFQS